MRHFLLPFASIIAALSLFSAGALAATTTTSVDSASDATPDGAELPLACQVTVPLASTPGTPGTTATTIATPTVIATAGTTTDDGDSRDNEDRDEAEHNTGQAIRACIAALHEDGEHGIGQTVSELAHQLNAEKHAEHEAEHGRNSEENAPPVASATPTAAATPMTSTATIANAIDQDTGRA